MTPLMIFCNLLIINVLWIIILDWLFFADEIGYYITQIAHSKVPLKIPKPFSCSTCMTWWTGLVYLLIVNQFTFINLLFLALICCCTRVTLHLIYAITGFFDRLIFLFEHLTGQDL